VASTKILIVKRDKFFLLEIY